MILTCSSCSTRYYANDAAIGPMGRMVRCASCGFEWFAEPELTLTAEAAEPGLTREKVERMRRSVEAPASIAPSAAARIRQQHQDRMRRERARVAVVAWGGTGAALAASVTGAVAFRQDVAELWPRTASAYAAVGLDVNVYGLAFENLAVERSFDGATPILVVSGEVHNIGRDDKAAPPVRITLRDAQDQELFEVVRGLDGDRIRAGERLPFQFRVDNPPLEAVDLETSFAPGVTPERERLTTRAHPPAAAPASAAAEHAAEEPLVLRDSLDHGVAPQASAGPIDGLAPRFTSEPVFGGQG